MLDALSPGAARRRAATLRSLARLLDAGVPPTQAATALTTADTGALADGLAATLRQGRPVSSAAAPRGPLTPVEAAVTAAGETSGRLVGALDALAARAETDAAVRAKLLAALAYPALLGVAIFTILPLPALVASGVGAYLRAALPGLAILGAAAAVAVHVAGRVTAGDAAVTRTLARVPGLSGALESGALVRAHAALAALLGAGVDVSESLRLASRAAGAGRVGTALSAARRSVREGATLGAALATARAFPGALAPLPAEGDATGAWDGVFDRSARMLADDHARRVRRLVAGVAAAAYALAALAVTWQVIASGALTGA